MLKKELLNYSAADLLHALFHIKEESRHVNYAVVLSDGNENSFCSCSVPISITDSMTMEMKTYCAMMEEDSGFSICIKDMEDE